MRGGSYLNNASSINTSSAKTPFISTSCIINPLTSLIKFLGDFSVKRHFHLIFLTWVERS
jgi:hypothetical protein